MKLQKNTTSKTGLIKPEFDSDLESQYRFQFFRLFATMLLVAIALLPHLQADFLSAADNPQLDRPQQKEKLELRQKLQKYGLTPDKASIQKFLQDLNHPNPDWSKAKKWIEQLGSGSYSEREEASISLATTVPPPLPLLLKASRNSDPELAYRAGVLFQTSAQRTEASVAVVLQSTNAFEIESLCSEILATGIFFASKPKITQLVRKAILTTATESDIPILRKQMADGKPIVIRKMSIDTLRKFEKPELANQFSQWFQDKTFSNLTRLECARALADLGDRRALNYLTELMLDGENFTIRASSKVALQRMTRKKITFAPAAGQSMREKQIVAWRKWIDWEGKNANLYFPLRPNTSFEIDDCFLIANYQFGKVLLLDESLDEVWSIPCWCPVSVEKMESGNILVACIDRVFEITPDKEIVREHKFENNKTSAARPLPNGNLLVANDKKVIELEANGKVVWELNTEWQTKDLVCRENGNIIVCTCNGFSTTYFLEEFDRSKKRIWKFDDPRAVARKISLLANGNILYASYSYGELDCKTRTTINIQESRARDAFRLANGNTVFLEGQSGPSKQEFWFREVDPDGKIIRSKQLGKGSVGSIRR